jgi:hypothetical protein
MILDASFFNFLALAFGGPIIDPPVRIMSSVLISLYAQHLIKPFKRLIRGVTTPLTSPCLNRNKLSQQSIKKFNLISFPLLS